jgi:hypothetical protein
MSHRLRRCSPTSSSSRARTATTTSSTGVRERRHVEALRDKPIGEGTFSRWWRRCLDDAGVPYRNPHTARHTFATRGAAAGSPPTTSRSCSATNPCGPRATCTCRSRCRCRAPHGSDRGRDRVAYLALVGPIPDGMTVHHTCGTRLCVNPGHLQLLDRATHGRLHSPATAERCARGHEVSDANTYHQERKNGSVQRVCRVCDRERTRARYHAARSGA